ncbi:hypothetical protein MP228_005801, partial [Amoeboaphelidium protococcarum]
SASDKTTGRSNKITITNDKGRLSQEDIERMVSEAEKYKKQDEEATARIHAKNGLESYAYNLRNTLNDDNLKGKINEADKETLEKAITETISWLDQNLEASKEEFESKQKELEGTANPIMTKLYQAGGMPQGAAPGGAPGAPQPDTTGPSVEEVD